MHRFFALCFLSCFAILLDIHPQASPLVFLPTTLRPIQEGSQLNGLEKRLHESGLEENPIEVYLDPTIKDGHLVGDPPVYKNVRYIQSGFWESPEVQKSSVVVLSNVMAFNVQDIAVFPFGRRRYSTTQRFNAQKPLRLLVLIDSKRKIPTAAYDLVTGKSVYSVEDLIHVYLDPTIKDGQLEENAQPFRSVRKIRPLLWDELKRQGAQIIGLANFRTFKESNLFYFSLNNHSYITTVSSDALEHLRLLVLVDPETRTPTIGYNLMTGEAVYPPPDQIQVYLNPVIENGQLISTPKPFGTYLSIPESFWKEASVQNAPIIVLAGVPTTDQRGTAVFGVANQRYRTDQRFDKKQFIRLLVVVDPKTKKPLAAYDMETKRQVFSIENLIRIYIDPLIEEGRITESHPSFRQVQFVHPSLWTEPEIQQATLVALVNVPTAKAKSKTIFHISQKPYVTSRRFNPDEPLSLLVLVNPRTREPVTAYDLRSGQEVYSAGDLIHVYLNPEIDNGRLSEDAKSFRSIRVIFPSLWDDPMIKGSSRVALDNISTSKVGVIADFFLGQKPYRTICHFDSKTPLRLLVLVDTKTRIPTTAYDMKTGKQVYPRPTEPVDERLKELTKVAQSGQGWTTKPEGTDGTNAGLEEGKIAVYLDPGFHQGRIIALGSSPYRVVKQIRPAFWKDRRVQQATAVVLENVPTRNRNGSAVFSLMSKTHSTSKSFDLEKPMHVSVIADPKTYQVREAYDMKSGEQVYSAQDLIQVYLDPELKNGQLIGDPSLFGTLIRPTFWKDKRVQQATAVVLENVTTRNRHDFAEFSLMGRDYATSKPSDLKNPMRLRVVVDPKTQEPTAAYDMATDEQVYSAQNRIRVYLDPKLKDGQLVGAPSLFRSVGKIRPTFWKNKRVQQATIVVLENVPARNRNRGRSARFSLTHKDYLISKSGNETSPYLRMVVDPKTHEPTAAYDMMTGEQVYPIEDRIQIYLDPELKDGQLVGTPTSFRIMGHILPDFWKNKRVQQATIVVLENVLARNQQGPAAFSLAGKTYRTSRSFDSETPLRLRVVADPKIQKPTTAYDINSGEQVYPTGRERRSEEPSVIDDRLKPLTDAMTSGTGWTTEPDGTDETKTGLEEKKIGVYLDPKIQDGQLIGEPKFFRMISRKIGSQFWRSLEVQEAKEIVLDNMAAYNRKGIAAFSLEGCPYFTSRKFDPQKPLYLRVVVDSSSHLPLAAYDMETKECLFSREESIHAYLNPIVENGFFVKGQKPFWVGKLVTPTFWARQEVKDADIVALTNIPIRNQEGAVFAIAKKNYRTIHPFDPKNLILLLVIIDSKTQLPLTAYDMKTGEELFSSEDQIRVYIDPPMEGGRFIGNPKVFRIQKMISSTFWEEQRVRDSTIIVLDNVPTQVPTQGRKGKNKVIFSLKNELYRISKDSDHLRVVVDSKSQLPKAAYDVQTGEQVFSHADQIQIYLGQVGQDDEVITDLKPFGVKRMISSSLWKEKEVQSATVVVMEGVSTRNGKGRATFSVSNRKYSTSRRFDPQKPLYLRVAVDPRNQLPTAAYDMQTGEEVFLAKEQTRIYVNPKLEQGHLARSSIPIKMTRIIREALWKDSEIRKASMIAVEGIFTYSMHGTAAFSLGAKSYLTSCQFDPQQPLRLLITANPQNRTPIGAYDMATGEQVYPTGRERRSEEETPIPDERLQPLTDAMTSGAGWTTKPEGTDGTNAGLEEGKIEVYLDPKIENGRLVGDPTPFQNVKKIMPDLWRQPAVLAAARVAFAGVKTYNSQGAITFSFNNKAHRTFRSFNPEKRPILILFVAPQNRTVLGAFDMATGEQIYEGQAAGETETLIPIGESIGIFLNPQIENGRLSANCRPYRVVPRLRPTFWRDRSIQQAETIALANVVPYDHQGTAAFHFSKKTYRTNRRWNPEHLFRLLIIVDPSSRVPKAAYDFSTGETVYAPEEMIQVYLNPSMEGGRIVGNPKPFRTLRAMTQSFWGNPLVQAAAHVVLSNVPTFKGYMTADFSVGRKVFRTSRKFDTEKPLKLVVVMNVETKTPEAAYDMTNGEQVYPRTDLMQIYLDPQIKEGQLVGNPILYRSVGSIRPTLWNEEQVKGASVVALVDVNAYERGGIACFPLGRRSFSTGRKFDIERPLKLLVLMDPKDPREPMCAYDRVTGEEVFSSDHFIRVYFDASIENGRLSRAPKPWKSGKRVQADVWDEAISRGITSLTLTNISVTDSEGKLKFIVAGKGYFIPRTDNQERPSRLLVEVDPNTRRPISAYDSASGDLVYSDPNPIRVYLDPLIEDGRMTGDSKPFQVVGRIDRPLWKTKEVQQAAVVALTNISTYPDKGMTAFGVMDSEGHRTSYRTNRLYDANRLLFLLVLVDPQTPHPLTAYDMATGEEVFSSEGLTQIFIDPLIERGRIVGNPHPFRLAMRASPQIWQNPQVQRSSFVAFTNIPTRKREKTAAFSFLGTTYGTIREFSAEHPLNLLVVIDPKTHAPIMAYDQATGEEVYSSADLINVHLDPLIKDGRIADYSVPFRMVQVLMPSFWQEDRVQEARIVALSNVRVHASGSGAAVFSIAKKLYRTSRRFNPQHPFRLLILVNSKTQKPIEAYDLETAEKVYPPNDLTHIYLNPTIQDGHIVGDSPPYRSYKMIHASFWKIKEVREARTIAFANYPVFQQYGFVGFSFMGRGYQTVRRPDGFNKLRLLLVVDFKTKFLVAYDFLTGEKVYPVHEADERLKPLVDAMTSDARWTTEPEGTGGTNAGLEEGKIAVYLDPKIENGRLVGNQKPFQVHQRIYGPFWSQSKVKNAVSIALVNVPTAERKWGAAFHIAGAPYKTTRPFDSKRPLYVLVLVNPKNRIPTAAYDMTTGEQIFSDENLIRIYLDPTIEKGQIVGDSHLFRTAKRISFDMSDPLVKGATWVVLDNVPTVNQRGEVFYIGGRRYRTTRSFDPKRPLKLLVLMDPKSGSVATAFDRVTGEIVYPHVNQIEIYLDPLIENGRFVGEPHLFQRGRYIPNSFWNDPTVKAATTVVLVNFAAYDRNGRAAFSLGGDYIAVSRPFDPNHPVKLLTVIDRETKMVSVAYDFYSGELVYPPEDGIRIYIDPEIEEGKLVGNPKPYRILDHLLPGSWKDSKIQEAERIALSGIIVRNQEGRAVFKVNKKAYSINRPFDPKHPTSLLVLVDPKTKNPSKAYNVNTGEEVYTSDSYIQIYLDPTFQEGRLVGIRQPFRTVQRFRDILWQNPKAVRAKLVVLGNFPTQRRPRDMMAFQLGKHMYMTTRLYNPDTTLRLYVLVNSKTKKPTAAYDMVTGEQVYPTGRERRSEEPSVIDERLKPLTDAMTSDARWTTEPEGTDETNAWLEEGKYYHQTWVAAVWRMIKENNGALRLGSWVAHSQNRNSALASGWSHVTQEDKNTNKILLVFEASQLGEVPSLPEGNSFITTRPLFLWALTDESKREVKTALTQLAETNPQYPISLDEMDTALYQSLQPASPAGLEEWSAELLERSL